MLSQIALYAQPCNAARSLRLLSVRWQCQAPHWRIPLVPTQLCASFLPAHCRVPQLPKTTHPWRFLLWELFYTLEEKSPFTHRCSESSRSAGAARSWVTRARGHCWWWVAVCCLRG